MSSTASLGVHGPSYNIAKIRELSELQLLDPEAPSFHETHKDSCYIFVGGIAKGLTEGDLLTVFSEWGSIVDINLVRDKETKESKGFAFLAYEDQRSTVLAVDNANGIRLVERNLRVDHVNDYVVFAESGQKPISLKELEAQHKLKQGTHLPRAQDYGARDHGYAGMKEEDFGRDAMIKDEKNEQDLKAEREEEAKIKTEELDDDEKREKLRLWREIKKVKEEIRRLRAQYADGESSSES